MATGQEIDNKFGCLLDYPYFQENDKAVAKDLSKQQAFNANLKTIQHINFSRNLDGVGN